MTNRGKNGMTNGGKDDMKNEMKNAQMKPACPAREQLMAYSIRLLDAPEEDAVGRHLGGCAACRAVAYEYRAVDAVLGEWKTPDPSPWFDARVRAAARQAGSARKVRRGVFGLAWTVWSLPLTMAALVVIVSLVALGVRRSGHSAIATGASSSLGGSEGGRTAQAKPEPMSGANEHPGQAGPAGGVSAAVEPGRTVAGAGQEGSGLSDAARIAEDDDMLANFDVLSELPPPPPGSQIAN